VKKGPGPHDIQKLQRRLVGFHLPFRFFSTTIVPPWPQSTAQEAEPHHGVPMVSIKSNFRNL
jgi:hypothetical protein